MILLGALPSGSMRIMVISICMPSRLQSAGAAERPRTSQQPLGRALFSEPRSGSGTLKTLLIRCLLPEEGRQTTETGFPKAWQPGRAKKYV